MVSKAKRALVLLARLAAVLQLPAAALAAGPPEPLIGQPFPFSNLPSVDSVNVAVAHSPGDNRFLVVHENNTDLVAGCLDARGVALATYVVPASGGTNPDVVFHDWLDEYLIVWEEQQEIWGARVGERCLPAPGGIGSAFVILEDPSGGVFAHPAVARSFHAGYQDYLVVAEIGRTATPTQSWGIAANRVYGASGGVGVGFDITSTIGGPWNLEPDVAYNWLRNEYLVVYTHDGSSGLDVQATDIYGRRVDNSLGGGLLAEFAIDEYAFGQRAPAVAAYQSGTTVPYLVVYSDFTSGVDKGSIWGRRVSGEGVPLPAYVQIAVSGSQDTRDPAVTSSERGTGYTVVWAEFAGDWNVRARRVMGDGTMQDTFTVSIPDGFVPVGTHESAPAVAGGSPMALAAWQQIEPLSDWDVYGRFLGYRPYVPLVFKGAPPP